MCNFYLIYRIYFTFFYFVSVMEVSIFYLKISETICRETWLKTELSLAKGNMKSMLSRKAHSFIRLCNYYIFDISVIIFV